MGRNTGLSCIGVLGSLITAAALLPGCGGEAPSLDAPTRAALPDELVALVPDDTLSLIRIESLDALSDTLSQFRRAVEPGARGRVDAREMLGDMGFPISTVGLDRTRPLVLAVAVSDIAPLPMGTLIVPVDDPASYTADLHGRLTGTPGEGYVSITETVWSRPAVESPSGSSRLAGELPGGVVSARIDVAGAATALAPVIDAAFAKLRAVSSMGMSPGMDMRQVLELYLDGFRMLLDSGETLELSLVQSRNDVALRARMAFRPGSPPTRLSQDERSDVSHLLSGIDPEEALVVVGAADMAALTRELRPFMARLAAAYPSELQDMMMASFTGYDEALERLGDGVALSGSLGPDGMRLTYSLESSDPGGLIEAYTRAMTASMPAGQVSLSGPTERTVLGRTAREYVVQMDTALFTGMQGVDDEVVAGTEQMLESLYGKDGIRLVYVEAGDRLLMVLGGDDEHLQRVVERADGPVPALPPSLDTALSEVAGSRPSTVFSMDLGKFMGSMARVMPAGLRRPTDVASWRLTVFSGAEGDVWSGGLITDLGELAAFGRSMSGR